MHETASCIKLVLKDKNTPSALLTRQGVPVLEKEQKQIDAGVLEVRIQFWNVMACLR